MNTTNCDTRFAQLGAALIIAATLVVTAASQAATPKTAAGDVVVVVSAASVVTDISRLHLADIYLGRTARFANGSPAVPIDQRAGSEVRASFLTTFLDRSEAQMKAHWSKIIFTGRGRPPVEAENDEAVKELVARDPSAIGYIDARLVDSRLRIVDVH